MATKSFVCGRDLGRTRRTAGASSRRAACPRSAGCGPAPWSGAGRPWRARHVPSGPLIVMRSITSRCAGLSLEREDLALVVEDHADDVHRVLVENPSAGPSAARYSAIRPLVHVGAVALLQMIADHDEAAGGLLVDLLRGIVVFLVGRPGDLPPDPDSCTATTARHTSDLAHVRCSHPYCSCALERHRPDGQPTFDARSETWILKSRPAMVRSLTPNIVLFLLHSPDDSPARSNCAVRCAGSPRPPSSRVSSSLTIRS